MKNSFNNKINMNYFKQLFILNEVIESSFFQLFYNKDKIFFY